VSVLNYITCDFYRLLHTGTYVLFGYDAYTDAIVQRRIMNEITNRTHLRYIAG